MKKRFLSLLLALVMCIGLATTASAVTIKGKAGTGFTAAEWRVYKAMEDAVVAVAKGESDSNEATIRFQPGELSWTAGELGFNSISEDNYYYADEKVQEIVDKAWLCLKYNLPFEMFWVSNSTRNVAEYGYNDEEVWVTEINCWLVVDTAYRGDSYDPEYPMESQDDLSADKIAKGYSVAEVAMAIVEKNKDKSDYEKLKAYKDAICSLTTYNTKANEDNAKADYKLYGDPWQLVYVFDGDSKTNVLCEGYAKAFKYLCDLSEFDGTVVCYVVEGDMDGEPHMWNVVHMGNGKYYLVDVTNSDEGMIGDRGGLFLAGASGSGAKYVVSCNGERISYVYSEEGENMYTDGYLPISNKSYSPKDDAENDPDITVEEEPEIEKYVPVFTDLKTWCEKEAVWAAQQGITNGYGVKDKFAPGVDCTQVQILTFLWRAAGKPASKETIFSPLSGDYAPAANWAYEQGIIDTSIAPNGPCTRADAVSYIWQALGKPKAEKVASFSDVDANASYIDAVSWAVEKGITKGYGSSDTFAPDRICNRGEIVCFLYRAYNN